jgi:hypothetical protein
MSLRKIRTPLIFLTLFICVCLSHAQIKPMRLQGTGVIVFSQEGNKEWQSTAQSVSQELAKTYPTYYLPSPFDDRYLARIVRDLESRHVSEIIVLPMFLSSYSEEIFQIRYLLGLEKNPPPTLMLRGDKTTAPKQIKTKLPIKITPAMDSDNLIIKVIKERLEGLGLNPQKTALALVGTATSASEAGFEEVARQQKRKPFSFNNNEKEEFAHDMLEKDLQVMASSVKRELDLSNAQGFVLRPYAKTEIREESEKRFQKKARKFGSDKLVVIGYSLYPKQLYRIVDDALRYNIYLWGQTVTPNKAQLLKWAEGRINFYKTPPSTND